MSAPLRAAIEACNSALVTLRIARNNASTLPFGSKEAWQIIQDAKSQATKELQTAGVKLTSRNFTWTVAGHGLRATSTTTVECALGGWVAKARVREMAA